MVQPAPRESAPRQSAPRRHGPIIWAAITILLLASLVGTLWVPFYARSTPKLGSLPFFYWYQLIWIPIVAILSGLAYLLINSGRARRGQRRQPGPDGQPGVTP